MSLFQIIITSLILLTIASSINHHHHKHHDHCSPLPTLECVTKDKHCPIEGLKSYRNKKPVKCINGYINVPSSNDNKLIQYPCKNMELLSFLTFRDLGSKESTFKIDSDKPETITGLWGADIWGWTDTKYNKNYALTSQHDGVSFVDVTNPTNPIVLAFIPSAVNSPIIWKDVKTYKHYVYIVADFSGAQGKDYDPQGHHGLQYYNLHKLRDIDSSDLDKLPYIISPDEYGIYLEFTVAHNIIINEDSGYLYAVGTDTCNSGLHIVDISDQDHPQFVSCYKDNGYIHDAQCIIYNQHVHSNYYGRELCFTANAELLSASIIDVTDKNNIYLISDLKYSTAFYTHQLWLTPNHDYLLLNDEEDERSCDGNDYRTRTYVFDIKNIENPKLVAEYFSSEEAISHNLYIEDTGNYAYLSNYQAGLRILNISCLYNEKYDEIHEVSYFDLKTADRKTKKGTIIPAFGGVWSSYIWFNDIVVSQTLDRGFYVLKPILD